VTFSFRTSDQLAIEQRGAFGESACCAARSKWTAIVPVFNFAAE
jgi:hypothetical protein